MLALLAPAARALGNDALVQHYFGEAQLALGRREQARESFRRALEIADLSQIAAARARLLEIALLRDAAQASRTDG